MKSQVKGHRSFQPYLPCVSLCRYSELQQLYSELTRRLQTMLTIVREGSA